MNWCGLDDPEFNQCCCNCIFHLPIHYHCCVDRKLRHQIRKITEKNTCICSIQKGWACVCPETKRVYDNWPEHSVGCECYTSNKKVV